MKVLIIAEGWSNGGTETYITGLANVLTSNNVDVCLALLSKAQHFPIDCVPVSKVIYTCLRGLASVIRRERPDVINLHLYSSLLPAILICKLTGQKTISTLHMPIESWGFRHKNYWRLAIRMSSAVVGVSRLVLTQLKANNVYKTPVPGGICKQFFATARTRDGLENIDKFTIVAIGRLSAEKDWPVLIAAVSLLPEAMRELVVVDFYGRGALQPELEALTKETGVRAAFHGHVDQTTLANALAVADLSILPSRFEGLGLSALESMAAGVPTITADFPAAHDFINHGVTGHLFPIGNADSLAKWIKWHITNPAASKSLGRAGNDFVRTHFSEETAYLPYLDIFRRVMG